MNNITYTPESLTTAINNNVESLNLFIERRQSSDIPDEVSTSVTEFAIDLRNTLMGLLDEVKVADSHAFEKIVNRYLVMVPVTETYSNTTMTNVNKFVTHGPTITNELRTKVLAELKNKENIHALDVAVGHIHDLIFERYNGSIQYCDRNNNKVEINLLDEPDGIFIMFRGSRQMLRNDQLNTSLYSVVRSETELDQDDVNEYVDLAEFLYDLLIENNINPIEYWDYG